MGKTNITIEGKGFTVQKMWIPELQDMNDVVEIGKREILEEELLEVRDSRIDICWECQELVDQCICKGNRK